MKIIFYSNHCPKCNILEMKLKQKNITYEECNDIEEMSKLGINFAPALMVDDTLLEYKPAIDWVNKQEEK